MNTIFRKTIYLAVIACCSLIARAGTVVQQEGGEIGSNKPKSKMTLYLDAGKMRVETTDPDNKAEKSIVIFDGSKQVMWMINPTDNTYREMDKAQMDAMGQQMSKAMEQMQAQMANMPPQQRAMMEEMMKKNMGGMGGAKPTISVKELGSEKVGSYNTTHYEMLTNGERTQEIWVAPFDQAKISAADIKTFQDMAKFFEGITRNVPQGSYSFSAMEQLKGFPVKSVQYTGGKPSHEWDMVSAEQKSIDGSQFTLPAGAKKAEMPGMGGPMGGGMGGPPGRRMGQ